MDKAIVVGLIDIFISNDDVSIGLANRIEAAIGDIYPEDEFVQDTIGMLASYRPGGGEYLYDESEISERLYKLKRRIQSHDN